MPIVYIVNKGAHDFTDAERYGDLNFLTEGSINRFATNQIVRRFRPIIHASKPTDYILATGLTVMNVLACAIFVLKHKKLNLLIHRGSNNTYVARTIDFSNFDDMELTELSRRLDP